MNYSIYSKACFIACKCQYSCSHTLVQDVSDTLVSMLPSTRYFYLFSCITKHTYLTPENKSCMHAARIFSPNSSMLHVSNIIHIWTDVCCTHAENLYVHKNNLCLPAHMKHACTCMLHSCATCHVCSAKSSTCAACILQL